MASPRGNHCRHAPRHAFVEIFEVLYSDGPPDLLYNFDDSLDDIARSDLWRCLMGKAILMKDNYRSLLPQGEMGQNEKKVIKEKAQKYNGIW